MTYAELLEESYSDNVMNLVPENDTFAAIDAFMTENFSIIMNESSDFDAMTISLEDVVFTEADEVDSEATKKNIGKAITDRIKAVITKIGEWLKKIVEAIARVIAKVNAAIATKQGEGAALKIKKIIAKYPDATIAEDITFKVADTDKVLKVLDQYKKVKGELDSKAANYADEMKKKGTGFFAKEMKDLAVKLDVFRDNITDSPDVYKEKTYKAGTKCEAIANEIGFDKLIKGLTDLIKFINVSSKDSVKVTKEIKALLEQELSDSNSVQTTGANKRAKVASLSEVAGWVMRSTTSALNLLAAITRATVSSSNKLAAAASKDGKRLAKVDKANAEEKKEEK